MNDENSTLLIDLGSLAAPLENQLEEQKVPFDKNKVNLYQRLSTSITLLYFQNFISDTDAKKLRDKLYTQIKRHVTTESKTH